MPLVEQKDAEIFILHVESDETSRALCARRLQSVPIRIALASVTNGAEARDHLLSAADDPDIRVPAIILLDPHVPVMTGHEFLEWLRSAQRFAHLQVIVLTTSRDERALSEAREMGANAVLNVRFTTTSITMGAAEILAYGSAVQVESI